MKFSALLRSKTALLPLFFSLFTISALAQPQYFESGNYTPPNSWSGVPATMSAGAGTSYIITTKANGTGNEYFRFYSGNGNGGSGTNYGPSSASTLLSDNTSYTLNASGNGAYAYYLNIISTSSNIIFKTNTTPSVVGFEVQGTVQMVSSVAQSPVAASVTAGSSVTVTATLSGAFATGQGAYLRYTSNGYSNSTVVAMTGSGTSYTAIIPGATNTANATVSYYVFTSGAGGGNGPNSNGSDADLFTINLNNNSGSNYTYTVQAAAPTTPVISSFTSSNPSGTTTGYTGSTITLTGTNMSGTTAVTIGGTAATNVTVVNPTTVTAVVAAGATGTITATNASGTGAASSQSFTYLGYITVNASSADWNMGSTWLGGAVPVANATAIVNTAVTVNNTATNQPGTVTVNQGASLSIGASTGVLSPTGTLTNNGTVTVGGTLTLATASTNSSTGTITVSNGGLLTANAAFANNAGITVTGAMTWNASSTNSSTGTITITASTGVLAIGTGGITNSGAINANGTFQINQGGYITGTSPVYGSATGTLVYNDNSGPYGTGTEWPSSNGPYNVTVQGGGGINLGAGRTVPGTFLLVSGSNAVQGSALTLNGTVQINGGNFQTTPTYGPSSTLIYNTTGASYGVNNEWTGGGTTSNAAGSGIPANVTINSSVITITGDHGIPGNFTINTNGTFNLNNGSGNLYVGGNFVQNGTFTVPTSKSIYFVDGNAQTISSTSASITFYGLVVNKTSGSTVTLNVPVTVSNTLTLTSGLIATSATNTLSIAAAASVSTGSTTSFVNGPLNRALPSGLLSSSNVYNFPIGSGTIYLPYSITTVNTGATGPVLQVTANTTSSGGTADGTTLTSINTAPYWQTSVLSGNYSGASLSLTQQSALPSNPAIGKGLSTSTPATTYSSLGGAVSGTTGVVSSSQTGAIAAGASQFNLFGSSYPAPTVTSVTPNAPIITGQANNTGYTGQTLTINGTSFVNGSMSVTFNGVAATSVTFVSATQLTAVVANAGAASSGNVVVTNTATNGGGALPFNYLGYITVNTSLADWNNGSTWLGGAVPVANAGTTVNSAITVNNTATNQPGTVLVNAGSSISVGASTGVLSGAVTNNGTVTVGGTLTLNAASTNGPAGTITVSSEGTLTVSGGLTNNGLLTDGGAMTVSTTTSTNGATGTLNVPGGATLTASAVLNNSGSMTIGGTITLNGGSTNSSSLTVSSGGTIILGNGLTNNGTFSVSGILQMNGGGYINGTSPSYTSSSTLVYNSNYGVYNEWTGGGNTNPTAGVGVPGNVIINNRDTVTLPNSGSTHAVAVGVPGNVTILGTGGLTLSTTSGLDFYLGGNWSRASTATFTNSGRVVNFVGSGTQTITVTGGGTESFAYITVGGSSTVQLSANAGSLTSVNVTSSSGLNLGSSNTTGNIDLNGQTMTISGGGNLTLVTSGAKNIISSMGTGTFAVSSYLTVTTSAGGTLGFGNNVLVGLTNGMDFGSGLSTIGGGTSGTLQLNAGGYVANNHPVTYGTGSLLQYNSNNTFGRNTEWSSSSGAGYPYNVQVSNSTTINYSNGAVVGALAIAGNLTIDQNSSLYLDYGYNNTPPDGANGALTIGGNVSLGGSMTLSTIYGGDLVVKGNWTITTTGSFLNNGRLVTFSGNGPQTITGATTFAYLTISNTSGGVSLASPITVQNNLSLTNGILTTTATNIPTVTNTATSGISGGSTTSFINGPVAWTLPGGLSTSANVYAFPVGAGTTYLPYSVTSLTTAGTGPTLQIQAFTGPSGGTGDGITLATGGLSTTEYWSSTLLSGSYTKASISLTRQAALNGLNVIGQSNSQGGVYTSIGGTPNSPSINNSSNTGGGGTTQFFVMAQKPNIAISSVLTPTSENTVYGTASSSMVLSVSGASMTSGILVTPPAGFEVSLTAGGTYSPTVTVGSGGTIASTPVYVRLAAATNAGTYSGNISLTASSANTITTAISNSVVSAATLTYTANTASRVYGAANPAFSGTVSGFVLNQTQASATTGTLTFTTTATVSSHAGQYPINGSGLTANNGNYTFVQATGNATALTIGQATPIVTVTGTTSFTYNGNQQGPSTASNTGTGTSYAFSYSGTGATTYGPSATEPVNAGSYTVTASVAASGDGNWTAASSAATAFTINTATLTITANNITKCNGATYTFAGTEFTTSGLVNGDGSSVNSVSLASAGAAAGAAPGTYSITPSAALGTGLSNYNITYTNGTLTVEAPITMTLTQVNPDCHGNPGSLTASAVTGGGVAPYTYKLNTGAFNPSGTYVSNPLFSSLSTGGYTYAVKDAYGCIGTQGAILSQLTKEPVLINNSTAPATVQVCYGAVTTITTNVVGGNPAFTYTLNSNGVNGTPQQSANRYFAVGAGSYYIIVTDSHTCSYNTDTIRVTQPSTALSLGSSVSTNIVNCTSSASTIILTAAGGYSSSYTYSDNNGSIYQASNSFAGLAPTVQTVYNLEVKDAMGCTAAGTATVQAVSEYILSSSALTGNTEACYGGTTTISTTPSGGTPPYMYSLDNGSYVSSSQRYFATVTPGSYTITVKDNAGCTYTPPAIVITQPSSALTFTVEATNANCLSITGSITIAAGGGYGGYSYSDNNGTSFQPSSSFTGLAAGTYNVVVKDMNGCTAYNTATVKEPTFTTSAIMGNLQVCYGATTSIYTVPSGGLTPYTYSLNGATVVTQAYRIFSVPAGNYYITVTDNEGCTATTPTVSVTQPPVPVELIAMQGGSVCTGDAGISVLALGGYGNYSYSDNGGSSYQSSNLFSNLGYGSYPIVVEDQNGCVSQTTVVKLTALTSSAIQGTLTVCPGGTTTIYTVPSGGAAPYSYRLDSSVYVPSNERYFNVPAGTHTIDVKDNASCTYTPPSVTVAMVSCTGLADGAADQKVETKAAFAAHVMPNPAQGAFHLQVESSSRENLELMVTNMQGVKVYEGRGGIDNTYEFGAAFTSGMYILQIRQGNEVHTVKLVKGN